MEFYHLFLWQTFKQGLGTQARNLVFFLYLLENLRLVVSSCDVAGDRRSVSVVEPFVASRAN